MGDFRAMADWLRKAADQGHIRATYSLAVAYGEGRGVAQSLPLAMKWFRKAANAGHAESQYNLGIALETGSFVKKNQPEADFWFAKAAAQGLEKPKTDPNKQEEDEEDGEFGAVAGGM